MHKKRKIKKATFANDDAKVLLAHMDFVLNCQLSNALGMKIFTAVTCMRWLQ